MPRKDIMDPRVADLVRVVARAIDPLGVPYAVGGAVALGAHGVRRHTADVDVFALEADRPRIARALRTEGMQVSPIFEPHHYIARRPDEDDPEVRIDLLFPADDPELSGIEAPVRAQVAGAELSVFSANMLALTKFYSDRIKDRADLAAMIQSGAFDPGEVRPLVAHMDPERVAEWDESIAELSKPRRGRPRPRRKENR